MSSSQPADMPTLFDLATVPELPESAFAYERDSDGAVHHRVDPRRSHSPMRSIVAERAAADPQLVIFDMACGHIIIRPRTIGAGGATRLRCITCYEEERRS